MAEPDGRSLVKTISFKPPGAAPSSNDEGFLSKLVGTINPPPGSQRVSESLDFEPIQNKVFYDRLKVKKEKRKFYGYTGQTLVKMLITIMTGVVTGICAVCLSKIVHHIIMFKLEKIKHIIGEVDAKGVGGRVFVAYLFNLAYSFSLVSAGTAMVQYWAPAAAGAGVTLVMAYLNGNHIPNLLRTKTLVTKFFGTVCAVSSGLPMGPEGPMVHIGACVASVMTYMECKCLQSGWLFSCLGRHKQKAEASLKDKLKVLDEIVSDTDHREFVSAGTAAGISAAFVAPIGGVLFAMEEACSFWSKKTAWRCFMAAVFATFTMAQLVSASKGIISFNNLKTMQNKDWLMQIPFMVLNAAMAGVLGSAFNSIRMWLWSARAPKTLHLRRILEVIGLVFLCVTLGFFFASTAGRCIRSPAAWYKNTNVNVTALGERAAQHLNLTKIVHGKHHRNEPEEPELEYGVQYTCAQGFHNDVATLFLSSNHDTITHLFSMPGYDDVHRKEKYAPHFTLGALVLFLISYLVEMGIGAGLAIPGGLFMPSIIVGATWGAFWGSILTRWLPRWNIQPGLYGIMAATGVLGGVFRSAISLVILVVEGTQGIEYMFGIIISVVVANYVAHHIHHDGVYESELERIGNVYFLRDEPPTRLYTLTAENIMATGVYGFKAIECVARIMEVLRNTTHNGFPVFGIDPSDPDHGDEGGRLEGLILRNQLLVLLQRRHFCDETGSSLTRSSENEEKQEIELEAEMRTFYRRYFTHHRYVVATAQPLDSLGLDGPAAAAATGAARLDLNNMYVDLRPYMNRSPFTVRKDCSGARVHQAFVGLGLRHLLVVDNYNRVVGIITRKDLDHAAGHGWWRMSHQAAAPHQESERNGLHPLLKHIPSMPQIFGPLFGFVSAANGNRSNHHHPDDSQGTQMAGHGRSNGHHSGRGRHGAETIDEETMGLRDAEDGGDEGHGRR